jgi:hypothetical protein
MNQLQDYQVKSVYIFKEENWSTHPTPVAKNGPRVNKLVVKTRFSGGYRSAFVPAPTARAGPPNKPAKNRQMITVSIFPASPAPMVKSPKRGIVMRYTGRLPRVSLAGEPIIGPNASPRTKVVNPMSPTSLLTLNRLETSSTDGG